MIEILVETNDKDYVGEINSETLYLEWHKVAGNICKEIVLIWKYLL